MRQRGSAESQRPSRLPLRAEGPGAELHCAADRLSVAYRRWLAAVGATFGTDAAGAREP